MNFADVVARIETFPNPYPGLRPFETEESHLFFGRDQQIAELVTRLERSRLVAVVGVSGSGKSSLVRAGLIPALERSPVGGARPLWRMVVTRPGGSPFESLADDLRKKGLDPSELRRSSHGLLQVAKQLPSNETLLVVVDQFEELFRYKDLQTTEETQRRQREKAASDAADFVQLLLAATQYLPPVYIVLTMRSDYLGDCAEFRGLPEALNECQYLVPRLMRQQRMDAIQGPLGPVEISPSLVQRMLNDAGDEPDRLPLLQHALMRTWSQWRKSDPERKRRIELQDYEAEPVGGLEHALDRHAEELLGDAPEDIKLAETIFRRLTAGTRRERRNPARLDELWEVCAANTEPERLKVVALIDRFRIGEATFLTPRDGTLGPATYIDITHESLIREWGRLREWVADEAESRAQLLRIHDDAQLYALGKADLWGGPRLQIALDWWTEQKPSAAWARPFLGGGATGDSAFGMARDFLEKSRQEAARKRRGRLILQAAAGVAMVVMAGLIIWGAITQKKMNAERRHALTWALAWASFDGQNEHPDQLELSTLYAIESVKREPTSANLHTLQLGVGLLRKRLAHLQQKGTVWSLGFSPDGQYLATAGENQSAALYDRSGKRVRPLGEDADLWAVAFSRDGKFIATGSPGAVAARIFDTASWKEVWRSSDWDIDAVAFSPDGLSLATGSLSGHARVYDGKTGKLALHVDHGGPVRTVALSPDGRYLATGGDDRTLRVTLLPGPGKPLWQRDMKSSVRSAAFDPGSRYLAVATEDGFLRVLEIQSQAEVVQSSHQGAVTAVAFSPDGRYMATASDDGAARVFEVADGREVLRQTHRRPVVSVAFSPDGKLLASGSMDGAVDLTEVAFPNQLARLHLPSEKVAKQLAATWDVKYLASVDEGGTAQVFDLGSGKPVSPKIHQDGASQVSVTTGGRYVALGGASELGVYDASNAKPRFSLTDLQGIRTIDITPDGNYVAAGKTGEVEVFDVAHKKLAWKNSDFKQPVSTVSFNADGRQLAVGGQQPEVKLFRAETGDQVLSVPFQWAEECKELREPCSLNAIAFSMDGKYVVLSASDKTARVIDIAQAREICTLHLPSNVVYAILSVDDRFLATSSDDWTGRAYEVATSREVWHMPLRRNDFFPLAFTSMDRYLLLATGSQELSVERHLWRPGDLIDAACGLVGRNLAPEEWGRLSRETMPRTCPGLP